ncbi:hypothetical protein ACHAWO_000473 [Cyclotella atomus]|jgi:tocopherol cyclase|uniref:Uncharacterized protein n=1 Tax=Cyclotella atomus TaxID=382360 RepID=A0ABD3PHW7_9STRA
MPPVALIVAAFATSVSILISTTQNQGILKEKLRLKFQPDKFQGDKKTHRYFEGWYYKFVSSDQYNAGTFDNKDASESSQTSMAVVPGIFLGDTADSTESHAFIFVTINGQRQHYYRFPLHQFSYANSSEQYYIQIGDNRFSHEGVSLNIYPQEKDDASLIMTGNLTFHSISPWPVSFFGLGAMGPVGWIPGLECTHGVLSFDHELKGSLTMASATRDTYDKTSPITISMDGGRGYTEKDFGRAFPSMWIWIQTNSFRNNPGTSLFVSIARIPIPLFGWELPGFTAAVWHDDNLIPFATWSGARFEELRVSKDEVRIVIRSGKRNDKSNYRVELIVDRRDVPEVLLYAPVNHTKMEPFVSEALRARVHMRLTSFKGEILIDDVGDNTGLEVHGEVQWLVDNVCEKMSKKSLICL